MVGSRIAQMAGQSVAPAGRIVVMVSDLGLAGLGGKDTRGSDSANTGGRADVSAVWRAGLALFPQGPRHPALSPPAAHLDRGQRSDHNGAAVRPGAGAG